MSQLREDCLNAQVVAPAQCGQYATVIGRPSLASSWLYGFATGWLPRRRIPIPKGVALLHFRGLQPSPNHDREDGFYLVPEKETNRGSTPWVIVLAYMYLGYLPPIACCTQPEPLTDSEVTTEVRWAIRGMRRSLRLGRAYYAEANRTLTVLAKAGRKEVGDRKAP